jgi:hypothetical protein
MHDLAQCRITEFRWIQRIARLNQLLRSCPGANPPRCGVTGMDVMRYIRQQEKTDE